MPLYVPLDADYAADPKIIRAGSAAELLFIRSLALVKRLQSDGRIDSVHLASLALGIPGRAANNAAALVREQLWTEVPGGWVITAWSRWNMTKDQLDARKRVKRDAATRGNHERWHADKPSPDCPICIAGAITPAIAPASQVREPRHRQGKGKGKGREREREGREKGEGEGEGEGRDISVLLAAPVQHATPTLALVEHPLDDTPNTPTTKLAQAVLTPWWEAQTPRPQQPYPAALKAATKALDTGWTPAELARFLTDEGCPISGGRLDIWRQRNQPPTPARPKGFDAIERVARARGVIQ